VRQLLWDARAATEEAKHPNTETRLFSSTTEAPFVYESGRTAPSARDQSNAGADIISVEKFTEQENKPSESPAGEGAKLSNSGEKSF
jgi:hypothetical protein